MPWWVWPAGKSAKKGLSDGPKRLMSLGREHPFASGAAVPGRCARSMQGCLNAHGPRHSPVRGYWQQLCQGLVTHTHNIDIFLCICMQTSMLGPNFPAPICCAQCETSRCAGARTVMRSAEIPLVKPISGGFQRRSLC